MKKGILSLVVVATIASLTSQAALAADHFLFYRVRAPRTQAEAALKGQFDEERVPGGVSSVTYFGNVVAKNREEIEDKNAHLAFYRWHQRLEEPIRVVSVSKEGSGDEI